jgi:TRAP-type mannitol/chloroaromatic compound transport system permease small subunit
MQMVAALVRRIDRLNEAIGRAVAWLSLAMVLLAGFVVVARYGFAWGRVWLEESYVWLHGVLFMLAAGYTLRHDAHVRVDIFYRPAGARFKAWVDLLGSLFLLAPVIGFAAAVSFPYVRQSWLGLEASREAGGLPGLFLLKTVILLFCGLILLQGLALAGRSLLVLRGHPEFAPAHEDPVV